MIYFWSILIESETFSCACDDFFKTADLLNRRNFFVESCQQCAPIIVPGLLHDHEHINAVLYKPAEIETI
jgi:hypothetical protein